MTKKIFTLALSLVLVGNLLAQEIGVYSQYQLFPVLYNPGVTGFSGNHEFLANVRKSLSNFPGTPITYTAMYHGSIGDRLGLGGQLFSERVGDMNLTKIQGNYAFRFRLQKAQIGIGLTTEFINSTLNNDVLGNPLVQPGDQVVEDHVGGVQLFDASVGTHILYDEKLFIGIALPNTVRTRLNQGPIDAPNVVTGDSPARFFAHFGYIINRKAQGFQIIPSLAIRSIRDVPFQADLNVQGRFLDDKLIGAVTLRPGTSGIAALMLGTTYKGAQIIYSYDLGFGPFQQHNTGSHEITLAYSLKPRKKMAATPVPVN
jgi:type IX secretion system PorP/SprF family membrane protein